MTRVAAWLLGCWLLVACTGSNGVLPPSGGRLYEVLLVGDHEGLVRQMLTADVEGLPQSEPSFDVSVVDSARFDASLRLSRNIVMVNVDPTVYTKPHVGYEKNVWAKPQMVIRVGTPSLSQLRRNAPAIASALRTLLNRAEINKTLAMMRHKRNTKAEQAIRQRFGVDLWIPVDMVASKQGENFVWLSNNATAAMQNIVVYRVPTLSPTVSAVNAEVARFVAQRNEVLGRAIKGETDSMWMTTVEPTVDRRLVFKNADDRSLWLNQKSLQHAPMTIYRGLWEMRGDDMGGPFVSRVLLPIDSARATKADGKAVVVEGFVFAPGQKKRNAMHRLEAVLYTLRWSEH